MHKLVLFTACYLVGSILLVHSGSAQITIPFNTAQQYSSNFTEIVDGSAPFNSPTYTPGNFLDWASDGGTGGRVNLQVDRPGTTSYRSAGTALYNPNASTTPTGPTYSISTTSFDLGPDAVLATSSQTYSLLARVQADGRAVSATLAARPAGQSPPATFSLAYGAVNSVYTNAEGSLASGDLSFRPTRMSLAQMDFQGVPRFDFTLSDNNGNIYDTGWLSLTQTTAYNNPGQVGFRMTTQFFASASIDNFSVSPVVPEPNTKWLCAVSLLGCALIVGKRRLLRS